MNGNLKGKDILSVHQFDTVTLDYIYSWSQEMAAIVNRGYRADWLSRKILVNLFYEPSTRTSSSFTSAMERLAGSVIPINEVKYSSVEKGEDLEDTVRTLECYADVIVLRHPEIGSAAIAAEAVSVPLINAGDGVGEHPTQALLDYVTVRKEQGRVDDLTVTMLGDMKHGRTVHSLARLLSLYEVKLNYVSPEILRMPPEIIEELSAKGAEQSEYEDLAEVLPETDVLYVTRVQKERFDDPTVYESVKGLYVVTPETLQAGKESLTIMHPLPRVGEILKSVDSYTHNAAYFRQMDNGLHVRMVLLAGVLGKLPTT
ncbi:aspartate carbamoyltransferase [Candidatus Woesebacteria bacterium RIFCSPHIGHO2_01_FULL_39_17]|uniref:Aspartate carbamoyltransferase n=1 Tax=Candidatus Woesebacteria bacterium RIFCSPLOWO2_01_FULL_39_14 TaxID=1802518 RepID=A0A1F8BJS7_9BACT|nr:MAG: aspartate carbamoyltransferase [Candidatus Woesebacteria bacterium RIFCSPHIGHO2_01_FULL_39_17]OGM64283.1 MAG: aspartate carbamoyltransferase [Candidatus Woesebacteria bacterium RIFCSPLOWO2_01_FULL_39_14]